MEPVVFDARTGLTREALQDLKRAEHLAIALKGGAAFLGYWVADGAQIDRFGLVLMQNVFRTTGKQVQIDIGDVRRNRGWRRLAGLLRPRDAFALDSFSYPSVRLRSSSSDSLSVLLKLSRANAAGASSKPTGRVHERRRALAVEPVVFDARTGVPRGALRELKRADRAAVAFKNAEAAFLAYWVEDSNAEGCETEHFGVIRLLGRRTFTGPPLMIDISPVLQNTGWKRMVGLLRPRDSLELVFLRGSGLSLQIRSQDSSLSAVLKLRSDPGQFMGKPRE